jgi:hypothetical protein
MQACLKLEVGPSVKLDVEALIAEDVIGEAYQWLCLQRVESSANNSIWDLRHGWSFHRPALQQKLLSGTYVLSPLVSYKINGDLMSSWSAQDALVLKALSLLLQPLFSCRDHSNVMHLKHAGGTHRSVEKVAHQKHQYRYVLKSDIYHYYESINHKLLLSAMEKLISCPILLNLVRQYCERLEIRDGNYYHFNCGIPKGCPLSPLMATLYLKPLDDEMRQQGFYVRFMDDWIVLLKTKRELRKLIKLTHKILTELKLKMHPDKTFIGAIKKGFDFLGVHFGDKPSISKPSLENHRSRLARRYAQNLSSAQIGCYIERWTSWCRGLLQRCTYIVEAYEPEITRRVHHDRTCQTRTITLV